MEIEADSIYQHDEYEEILVLGINRRYEAYTTEEKTGVEDGVYVQYTDQWDGYGAMSGATRSDPVAEFTEAVGEKLRRFKH